MFTSHRRPLCWTDDLAACLLETRTEVFAGVENPQDGEEFERSLTAGCRVSLGSRKWAGAEVETSGVGGEREEGRL